MLDACLALLDTDEKNSALPPYITKTSAWSTILRAAF